MNDKPVITITQGKYVKYLTFYDLISEKRITIPVVVDENPQNWVNYSYHYPGVTAYPMFEMRRNEYKEPDPTLDPGPLWFWNGSLTEPTVGPKCIHLTRPMELNGHAYTKHYHTYVTKGHYYDNTRSPLFRKMLPVDEWPELTLPPRKPGDENE